MYLRKAVPYETVCALFDQHTHDGKDMELYSNLIERAVGSIATTFRKRIATGIQSGRSFVIPKETEQANEATDFELVTWIVIKGDGCGQ
jgi:hypothetical protein